jgi:CRISPR type I-E-associated protein CasB/Cse2
MMMTSDAHSPEAGRSRSSLGSILARLSVCLRDQRLGTGGEALLRRLDARHPDPRHAVALYRLLAEEKVPAPNLDQTVRWSAIINALALCRGAHTQGQRCGEVLYEMGISESRLAMLLAADRETLIDLLPRLACRLAASRQAMDWWPLAHLMLTVDVHPEEADDTRRRVARDYVRAQVRDNAPSAAA